MDVRDGAGPSQTGRLKSNVEGDGVGGGVRLLKREVGHIKNTRGRRKKTTLFDIVLCISKQEIHRTKGSKEGRLNNGRDVKSSNFSLFTPEAAQIAGTDAIRGSIDTSLRL